jgi:hypothetical protein
MAKTNAVHFRCDQCDTKEQFDISNPLSERDIAKIQAWYEVVRENGTQQGDRKAYCTASCLIFGARSTSNITLTDNPKPGETVPGSSLVVAQ